MKEVDFKLLRERMVSAQIAGRGISDQRVLDAFCAVPRHLFVPEAQKVSAYQDSPLPIGLDQTISQPYMVALMTDVLEVSEGMKVLEVGTGSGYQAAILAHLGARVYSIERLKDLSEQAKNILDSLGYRVELLVGDGTLGWPDEAPYDRIIVTAAARVVPQPLKEQLKVGAKLVIPVGGGFHQDLIIVQRVSPEETKQDAVCGCIFVPLIGRHGCKEQNF
jgi:protein-L-isoaspartate(D-aspartate) O-methyltransferase